MDRRNSLFLIIAILIVQACNTISVQRGGYIKEITDGPLKKYSGQPLVDLGGTNYFFDETAKLNWMQSQETCHSLGLFGVGIETMQEYELIRAHIRTLTAPVDTQGMWISGNCLSVNGTWVWHGTGQPIAWFDWSPGEPLYDRCMQLWKFYDWMMDDYWCYAESGLICEEMVA